MSRPVKRHLNFGSGGLRLRCALVRPVPALRRRGPVGVLEAYLVRLPAFCYADCDESTGRRVLDLSDFLEFQRRFALQDLYSDGDQNGAHNLFDFLCFQNGFAAGCP